MVRQLQYAVEGVLLGRRDPLETALRSVFPKRLVTLVKKTAEKKELLDALTEHTSSVRAEVLQWVADKLRIGFAERLSIPDAALIGRTGFDVDELRRRTILPQYSVVSAAGYALVASDPSVIDVEAFRRGGVQILLGSYRQICHAWRVWDAIKDTQLPSEALSEDVRVVLKQIVEDCSALGAAEVFLGHPGDRTYEGFANGQRFSGFMHERVFSETMAALAQAGNFSLDSQPVSRVSLTRNFERSIICVTWPMPHRAQVVEKPSTASNLPLQPTSDAPHEAVSKANPPQILFVDDDDVFAGVVSQILKSRGYKVQRARNGREALDLIEAKGADPNLIISDVHMPMLDGRGFLEAVRQTGSTIPVLMLTSDQDPLLETDLVLLGASAYLRKNDDPRVLLAWTENLVSKTRLKTC